MTERQPKPRAMAIKEKAQTRVVDDQATRIARQQYEYLKNLLPSDGGRADYDEVMRNLRAQLHIEEPTNSVNTTTTTTIR